MAYNPIADYGVIGNMKTVALVGLNGSIDFMCCPGFDSPSVFCSLLDDKKGGFFRIAPILEKVTFKQMYIPDTNVILTRFLSPQGLSELTDFMPVLQADEKMILIRRLSAIKGEINFRVQCSPSFNYAKSGHSIEAKSANSVLFRSDSLELLLTSSKPLEYSENDIDYECTLKQGEKIDFILEMKDVNKIKNLEEYVNIQLYKTIEFWKGWVAKSKYKGLWREAVNRSALVLKLLSDDDYGSLIASPTFGLPEFISGNRNWDYRYCWLRDASFSVHSLITLGYKKEAKAYIRWVEKQCQDIGNAGYLDLMYTIEGNKVKDEEEIELNGYQNSHPVLIGNNAHKQFQLDIYGELLDAVYLFNKLVEPITYDFWKDLGNQVNWLADNWQRPDEGIWEARGGPREFLHSRLMCWVAFDRIIRIAHLRSFPYPRKWRKIRNEIFYSIYNDFWDEESQCFVQFKGAKSTDAGTLLLPLVHFISPHDQKWKSTLKAIENDLVSDSLVYRYKHMESFYDPIKSGEGTFSVCTFWYIEALCRSGQVNKARFYFEKMLGYSNHVGLYAEELSITGEHLGNFPQAFTHLALINAALTLDKFFSENSERKTNNFFRKDLNMPE